MKRLFVVFLMIAMVIALSACNQQAGNETTDAQESPSAQATAGAEENGEPGAAEASAELGESPETSPEEDNTQPSDRSLYLEIQSYFPVEGNVHIVYDGIGNEYASYELYTEYIRGNAIQYKNVNSKTLSSIVYVNEDGALKRVYWSGNEYCRANVTGERNMEEILLVAPIELGNTWDQNSDETRTITGIDVPVVVPYGSFQAVEVTIHGDVYTAIEYYAAGAGLIKSEFYPYDVTDGPEYGTELAEVEFGVPYTDTVTFYYPDFQTAGSVYASRDVAFYTGDTVAEVFDEFFKSVPDSSTLDPIIPITAQLLNVDYDARTNVVTADFSSELITDLNSGAENESIVLTCVANTFAQYYGADYDDVKIAITIEGGPYESGHSYFGEGDYLTTDFINICPL